MVLGATDNWGLGSWSFSGTIEEKVTAASIAFFNPVRKLSLSSSDGGRILDILGGVFVDTPNSLPRLGHWNRTLAITEDTIYKISH